MAPEMNHNPIDRISHRVQSLETFSFVAQLETTTFRLRSRQIMIALSHIIEEQAAAAGPGTVLIAAFQRLSLFAVEADRYCRLAPHCAHVYVLGVADISTTEIPHVTVVPLDDTWPLVQEWSVIASGPRVALGLFARDAEGFRLDRRSRSFAGVFTTETTLVDAAMARFHTTLGLSVPVFERDHRATYQHAVLAKRALAAHV